MTEGVGARPDFSYPSQLAGITGLPVINAGHRGDTAGEAIDRLECDVFSHSPGLVLLCLGGNDLIRRIPPQTTMRDLETIIVQTHARQIPVCILGLRGSWLLKIDHDLPTRQLARDTGCPLLPLVLDGIWGIPWKMAEHVHPNRWGYREMAQRVARTLAEHGVSCAEISSKNNPPTAP
jgi:lysophospholipase L1-like esterase